MNKLLKTIDGLADLINDSDSRPEMRSALIASLSDMLGYLIARLPEEDRLDVLDFALGRVEERFIEESGMEPLDGAPENKLPDQNAPSSDALQ